MRNETAGASTTRLGYDGGNVIAEYNSSDALQRRYVFGPGTDEPLVQYEGTGTSTRRYFHADERGSIVATSDGSGALTNVNSYDEYGIPASTNAGRFQYTGQVWLAELGMSYYRNRIYSPTLGRFMQTDPIGFDGGMNIYAYTQNDPVNFIDPSGECGVDQIVVKDWSPPWTEAGGGDAGSEDGHPVVTAHYHCVRMPSVPTPGGTRTPGSGGGTPFGSGSVPCTITPARARHSGRVFYWGVTASAHFGTGASIAHGHFRTQSGITGDFTSIGFGFGAGVRVSGTSGTFNNLGSFMGGNDNLNLSVGPYEIGTHSDLNGNTAGSSGGVGGGSDLGSSLAELAGPMAAMLMTSISASFSNTDLTNVTCPRGQ